MKKILSILFAGVMALMATACFPEEKFATFDPAQATAPMLLTYNIGDKAIQAGYTPGQFNMGFNDKMAVNHKFVIVSVDGKETNKSVASYVKDNLLTVSVSALSTALVSLGCQEDQTVNFEMVIRASMQNPAQDNGRNGFVDSKDKVVVNGFVVTFPKGSPYQEYTAASTWGVTGALSAYGIEWNGDLEMFATEDGTRLVAKAVTLKKEDQFKFRKDAAWTENFGAAADVEPFIVSLDNGMTAAAGGKNMAVPADGIYDLWLDLSGSEAVITVTEAYLPYPAFTQSSTWGVTGALSAYGIEWNGDLVMTSDGTSHLAQGVTLKKEDQFKFRKDGAWTENFGAAADVEPFIVTVGSEMPAAAGGKNLAVPEDGVYDLIVNPESQTITISETLGGGVSGIVGGDDPDPDPDPVIENAWSVIGSVEGTSWDKDFYMTESDGIWSSEPLSFAADAEFKLRFNNSWADADCIGAAADGYALIGAPFTGVQPGANFKIQEEGYYQIILEPATLTVTIKSMSNRFSLIGEIAGSSWDKDFFMTQNEDIWTYGPVNISGGFKIRFNRSWADTDTYGTAEGFEVVVGEPFNAVQPGSNITVAPGDYIVVFDAANKIITINPALPANLWSVIGSVNGTSWDKDFYMTENDGVWISEAIEFTESSEFKVRFNNSWSDENTAGAGESGILLSPGKTIAAAQPGNNMKVAEPGTYRVVFDTNRQLIYLQGWALIGGIAGSTWDRDFLMTIGADGRWYSSPVQITGEFKIRFNGSWADSDTRGAKESGFAFTPLTPFEVEGPGNNIQVPEAGFYTVAFDAEKNEVTIFRSEWALIGNVAGSNWNQDFFMVEYEAGIYTSSPVVISGEFKIRRNASWADADTRGAGESGFVFTPGEAFKVVGPGQNINVPENATFVVKYNPAEESVVIAKQ